MHDQLIRLNGAALRRTSSAPHRTDPELNAGAHEMLRSDAAAALSATLGGNSASRTLITLPHAGSMCSLTTAAPLIFSDSVSLCLCVVAGMTIASFLGGIAPAVRWGEVAAALPLLLVYFLEGLYPAVGIHPVIEIRQIIRINAAVALAAAVVFVSAGASSITLFSLAVAALLSLVAVPVGRAIARQCAALFPWWGIPVMVCGVEEGITKTVLLLKQNPSCGLRPFIASDSGLYRQSRARVAGSNPSDRAALPSPRENEVAGVSMHVATNGLLRLARRANIRHVIVVSDGAGSIDRLLSRLSRAFPHVLVVGEHAGLPTLFRDARSWQGLAGIEVRNRLLLTMPRILKRAMDLFLVLISLPLLAPLLLVIAVLIRISAGGPVFFGHRRYGRRGKPFVAWKFRTMVPNAAQLLKAHLEAHPELRPEWEKDHKLRNDPRVTRLGNWLRRTSLDELPQLFNVLCGQMSLVGPRPIVQLEIEKYGRGYLQYKQVLPGITGLWQVSGRNDTTYDQRVDFDRYYVQNWSPWLDAWILFRTVRTLATRRGAY